LKDNRLLTKEGGKALAQALAGNSTLKELDVSNNNWEEEDDWGDKEWKGDGPGFAQELAVGIKDNGALSSLNLAANNLGELVLPEGWTEDWDDEDEIVYGHTDGRTQKEHPGKPDGIIAIANAIPDMGAMTSLDISNNSIGLIDIFPDGWSSKYNDGCAPFVHTDGRKQNVVPEGAKSSGVIAIANVIPDMRAMSTVIVNTFPLPIQDIKSKSELDFSGRGLKVEDAIIIAALIPANVSRKLFCRPYCH
jgi:hypothetical protein